MNKITRYLLDLMVLLFALFYSLSVFASNFDITEIMAIISVMMIYIGWHLYTVEITFKDVFLYLRHIYEKYHGVNR